MFKYIALDLAVMAVVAAVLAVKIWLSRQPLNHNWRLLGLLTGLLILLTTGFDSILVASHIVAYHHEHILGVYIIRAPLEDFAYTLVAVTLLPSLWQLNGGRGRQSEQKSHDQ